MSNGIQLGVEHVMVGNGYTTCIGVEHVMVGNGYTTWCRTCNGGWWVYNLV